jgi:hypothetical protein
MHASTHIYSGSTEHREIETSNASRDRMFFFMQFIRPVDQSFGISTFLQGSRIAGFGGESGTFHPFLEVCCFTVRTSQGPSLLNLFQS